MSYASDDLAPLLAAQPGPAVGYRQGVIRAWNPQTAENTVEVAGAVLTDLPILNTNEALLLAEGDVVGILTTGGPAGSWVILGRLTIPGTPQAASALSMVSNQFTTSVISTLEATSSTSYVDLATVGPTVTVRVGASGKLLLMISATINYNSAAGGTDGGEMSFEVSGATSIAAGVNPTFDIGGVTGAVVFGRVGTINGTFLLTGLSAGDHDVTVKYKSSFARSVSFYNRVLVALPM